jgi:hypothetical protein
VREGNEENEGATTHFFGAERKKRWRGKSKTFDHRTYFDNHTILLGSLRFQGEEEGGEAEPPRNRPMEEMGHRRASTSEENRKIGEVGSHFLRVEEMGGGEEERSKATGRK